MKKQFAILGLLVATADTSALADGYVTFSTAPLAHAVWDEFTTPGLGVLPAANSVDATFLWAPLGTTDPLPDVGGVPTNGVTSVPVGWSAITVMLSSGWTAAMNGSTPAVLTLANSTGIINYGHFPLAGTSGGTAYEFVTIGWNASAGTSPASVADLGWSNPFDYTTGVGLMDPVGETEFNQDGMDPFGIAPVPEPATLALAGLGALSLLLFRRRK